MFGATRMSARPASSLGDPLVPRRFHAHRVVQRQRAFHPRSPDRPPLGHLRQGGRVHRGRHLGVHRLDGAENGHDGLRDSQPVRQVHRVLHDVDLLRVVRGDAESGVGDEVEAVGLGKAEDPDVGEGAPRRQAVGLVTARRAGGRRSAGAPSPGCPRRRAPRSRTASTAASAAVGGLHDLPPFVSTARSARRGLDLFPAAHEHGAGKTRRAGLGEGLQDRAVRGLRHDERAGPAARACSMICWKVFMVSPGRSIARAPRVRKRRARLRGARGDARATRREGLRAPAHHAAEGVHDVGIELGPLVADHLAERIGHRHGAAVGAGRCHGIEGIRYAEDLRKERELFPRAAEIPLSVEPLMVLARHLDGGLHVLERRQDLRALLGGAAR